MAPCEIAESFPVVMLYDHFSSVGVAMATYNRLIRELEGEFKPELRVWRMDVATSPESSAEANADIAAAEVIILTVRGDQPWPTDFLHWKEGAVPGGAVSPHAIILLLEEAGKAPEGGVSWNTALRSAATQIHPEVFVYETKTARGDELMRRLVESDFSPAEIRTDVHLN